MWIVDNDDNDNDDDEDVRTQTEPNEIICIAICTARHQARTISIMNANGM